VSWAPQLKGALHRPAPTPPARSPAAESTAPATAPPGACSGHTPVHLWPAVLSAWLSTHPPSVTAPFALQGSVSTAQTR